ncbi:hypothetical protein [Modestobacter italicus]|uniref:hypothetical protein n=1 Tax=Modestobacter italicus (strain DSM 44449 / CECT 9708 / BC 501) TaxID=2732864 RepID=UPI001C96CE22|nr:hypothetical protein [Modestobacter italicus]
MSDDLAPAVAARLRQLTDRARPADLGDTSARAAAVDRRRRRRAAGWVAGALAVVLLATGASLARSTVAEPVAQQEPQLRNVPQFVPDPPMLYEAPVRGSLADDEEFLGAMAVRSWQSAPGDAAQVVDYGGPQTVPETHRVVYAADVPGGQRWVVVLGRAGPDWLCTWFTGPRGAEPEEMTVALRGLPLRAQEGLALTDVSAASGPLVVLAASGTEAEYSPSLDRGPDGTLGREYRALPLVDGVPLGIVPTPITWNAGDVRLADGGGPVIPVYNGQAASWPVWPAGPVDDALAAPCLEQLGLTVDLSNGGLSWGEANRPAMSSAEEAAREAAIAACFRAAAR